MSASHPLLATSARSGSASGSDVSAPQRIAVLGSGISGMAAAWLLSRRHKVTVFEKAARFGGHSNTVEVSAQGVETRVDTGFIVFNESCYPNLAALFRHLGVATRATDMSLGISLDDGALEYAGDGFDALFAQRRNLVQPRFWSMLRDLVRFYREAPRHLGRFDGASIGDWLAARGYGAAFRDDHLMPMAAAIWSAPASRLLDHPAEAFVQFCQNHGLLTLGARPQWRTVEGGSIEYVRKLTAEFGTRIVVKPAATSVSRPGHDANAKSGADAGVRVRCADGSSETFDAVVIATHADEALALLDAPSAAEQALLGIFRYSHNRAVLHGDAALMPQRRKVWSSWNYLGRRTRPTDAGEHDALAAAASGGSGASGMSGAGHDSGHSSGQNSGHAGSRTETLCLTYWMNRLQHLDPRLPLFVTLNPGREPDAARRYYETHYTHPIFNGDTLRAQRRLWELQGQQRTWFCGAYFGAGFHEDGLQAGLAVAEQLGGAPRPWTLAAPSGRIHVLPDPSRRGLHTSTLSEAP